MPLIGIMSPEFHGQIVAEGMDMVDDLDRQTVNSCVKTIQDELGSLNDLRKDLADTIANVYFRYYNALFNSISTKAEQVGLHGLHKQYVDVNLAKMDIESITEMVRSLRDIKDKNLYN